jgi:putative PEP-CTERM system TPR-repeat lipoprotein
MTKPLSILIVMLLCVGCEAQSKEQLLGQGMNLLQEKNPQGAVVYLRKALEKDSNFTAARFELAKAYGQLGRTDAAEREFIKVLKQEPERDEVELELANLYLAAGKGEQALKLTQTHLEKHSRNAEAIEAVGRCYLATGRMQEGETYLLKCLQLDANRVSTKLQLACVWLADGRVDKARNYLTQVLVAEPKNLRALYLLADVETKGGDSDGALAIYKRILNFYPSETAAQYSIGITNLKNGRFDEAEAGADAMLKKSPNNADGHRLKGLASYYRKNYSSAVVSFQTAQNIAPALDLHYFLGLCRYQQHMLEDALREFRLVLNRQPNNRQARLMVAQILLLQGNADEAVTETKKIVKDNDADAAAHDFLGIGYLVQGLFEDGMRELEKASSIDPKLVDAYLHRGRYYLATGKDARAERELAAAVRAAPAATTGRLLLAAYYHHRKETSKAMSVLQAGLRGGEADAELYNAMAVMSFGRNDPATGIRDIERAKRCDPTLVTSYLNLAAYYAAASDYPQAIQQYEALLKMNPRDARALLGLAHLYEKNRQDREALAQYQKAARERVPEALMALAEYHLKRGRTDDALLALGEAISVDPQALAPLEAKGCLLVSAKRYFEALGVSADIEKIDLDAGVKLKTAIYLELQDYPAALEQARRLVVIHPDSAAGHLLLAKVHQSRKDVASAINELKNGIKVDSKNVTVRVQLGRLLETQGENAGAMAAYREALHVAPRSIAALFAEASLLDRTGRKKEATTKYRAILQRNEAFVPALNNLAYLYADGYGDRGEALRLATSAFQKAPGNTEVMDTLGYALLRNGRSPEAVNVLETASGRRPEDAAVKYHLALAYKGAGNRRRAEEVLQTCLALETGPQTKAARALLNELRR